MEQDDNESVAGAQGLDVDQGSEVEPRDPLRIYVADLAAYNSGWLHGVWVDACQDAGAMWVEVNEMLAHSPVAFAEEIAIHDYEGFGPVRLSEYESLTTVAAVAAGVEKHGRAFLYWVDLIGTADVERLDEFEEHYIGWWESAEAYAEELVEDAGLEGVLDEHVADLFRPYVRVDAAALGRDLVAGQMAAQDEQQGGVYLFWP